MENNTNTFRTKFGYCHILADRIVLNTSHNPDIVGKAVHNSSIMRTLIMYGLLSLCLIYQAYVSLIDDSVFFGTFFGAGGLLLLYAIFTSFTISTNPVIERAAIEKVEYTKTIPGITRSRFVVFFKENGRRKKRMIMLPGTIAGGAHESEKALKIMRREGLIAK